MKYAVSLKVIEAIESIYGLTKEEAFNKRFVLPRELIFQDRVYIMF
jgi:hypothetical protein